MGSAAPRKFVESAGIRFTSEAREAYPQLTPTFESTTPGIYVIGALAGYPLIKHCMNQGYDVVEYIVGNTRLKPADEPILEARLEDLPLRKSVAEWIEFLRGEVEILRGLSPLQLREFLLDCTLKAYKEKEVIFQRNMTGSSLFGVASGSVKVEVNPGDPRLAPSPCRSTSGSIFGEVGLIFRAAAASATVRAGTDCIVVEIPRNTALKLMASVKEARDTVNRITTERQLLQIFGSGLSRDDIQDVLAVAEVKEVKSGEAVVREGEEGYDIYVVRSGSMTVEKAIGGKQVFLSYIPAGSYFGEMALIDGGRRTATVRAAIRSQVIRLNGDVFRALLARKPLLAAKLGTDMAMRRAINGFIEKKKEKFSGVVDMYSQVAEFLVEQGLGEATDALLIDEKLCIGCDNCEKACADSHDGLSRLNREAGRVTLCPSFRIVPTSCRHCGSIPIA